MLSLRGLLREAEPDEEEDKPADDEDATAEIDLSGDADTADATAEEPAEDEEKEDPTKDPEMEEPKPKVADEDPGNSLDNQIDALLIDFESDSLEDKEDAPVKSESLSLRLVFGRLLCEAEGDEEDKVASNDEPTPAPTPVEPEKPRINVDVFAQKIARLVMNYQQLLDVPGAIVDRARKYIQDNYDDDVLASFDEVLVKQHDIEVPGKEGEGEYPIKGPPAVGAEGVPSGGGGFGGGEAAAAGGE